MDERGRKERMARVELKEMPPLAFFHEGREERKGRRLEEIVQVLQCLREKESTLV